jgi:hypothetical protein
VTGVIFGLALGGSLTLDPVTFVLGLAAHQFFFLALALVGFAHAGIRECTLTRLAFIAGECAQHHTGTVGRRHRRPRLRRSRALLHNDLGLAREHRLGFTTTGGLVVEALALGLHHNRLGAAVGEALLHA